MSAESAPAQRPEQEPATAEAPWPVAVYAEKVAGWIHRLGSVWVEGQLTELTIRGKSKVAFLTLRDPEQEISVQLTCPAQVITAQDPAPEEGSRVAVLGKPTYYKPRGTLSLRVQQLRQVGIGELLARIERLRRQLAAEGLLDPARKRTVPSLPAGIGLITGRGSAAERDVLSNARARWPEVSFRVRNVTTQGPTASHQVRAALAELDADPDVAVIVIARGGGSVEDLLPFSDEELCRAVANATTPVVSAIGHEPDSPLLDQAADLRCSTPTDAGKSLVPDAASERDRLQQARGRIRAALRGWVQREQQQVRQLRNRPVLADPAALLAGHRRELDGMRERSDRSIHTALRHTSSELQGLRARLQALGPSATLARGYAVVQRTGTGGPAEVVRALADAPPGSQLRIRVTDGALQAAVLGVEPAAGTGPVPGPAGEQATLEP